MVYKDGTTNIEFANKLEWFDFLIDRNQVILQGEHVESFVKRLNSRLASETDTAKQNKIKALLEKVAEEQ